MAGDSTWFLHECIARQTPSVAVATIFDPQAVILCHVRLCHGSNYGCCCCLDPANYLQQQYALSLTSHSNSDLRFNHGLPIAAAHQLLIHGRVVVVLGVVYPRRQGRARSSSSVWGARPPPSRILEPPSTRW